ncbi:MAG: hypothetical protein IJF40_05175 [Clostridia bacterium]|nr:hypothetical protein [Clostridia bacterium]
MEQKPFESKSKLSLDKILSEIAEVENKYGEPEKLWSMDDINSLLGITEPENKEKEIENKASDTDSDILSNLDYLEDKYSESVSDDYAQPEDGYADETASVDEEPFEVEEEQQEAVIIPYHPENTSSEPNEEDDPGQQEPTSEDTYELEVVESEPQAVEEADEQDSTEQESEEEFVTIALTPIQEEEEPAEAEDEPVEEAEEEKKPTVEELFPSPEPRYFGDDTSEVEQAENSSVLQGLFDADVDESIFKNTQNSDEDNNEENETAEYKNRFIQILDENKKQDSESEPIEKHGIILKRGPLSETSGLEPLPQVIPAEELVGDDDEATRIMGTPAFTNPQPPVQEEQDEQLVFSGFNDEEEESQTISEEDLAAELARKRAEKKKKFVLISKFDEDEEVPESDIAGFSDAETDIMKDEAKDETRQIFEYDKPEHRGKIFSVLKNSLEQAKTAVIGLCIIDAVALVLMLVPGLFELIALDAPAFAAGGFGLAIANIVILFAGSYLALPALISGFKALFSGNVNCETAGALAVVLAFIHAVVMIFNKEPAGAATYFYSAAAIFALLLNTEGRRNDMQRMLSNFEFCAFESNSSLYAIRAIENEKDAFEVGRGLKMGNPEILYSGKIAFPENFIANSRACSTAETCVKRNIIISAAISAVLAILTGILTKDVFQAVSALTGTFCLTSPIAVLLSLAIPLYLENKKLNENGAMVASYDAAEKCSSAVAAAIDSSDLFDRAACEMHGMKDFKTVRIDDVLLYATAIVLKSGGPLSGVFNGIIGGSTEILPPVKDMIYEDRLGLSATIYGQRVLLGNRNLLVHHNIDVPLKSEEDKYKLSGRKVVYIAIDSQVAAMFVVKYVEDSSLTESLHELEDNGFNLVVRTDDPNVTDELLAQKFSVASKSIKVTSSNGAQIFRSYRDSIMPSCQTGILHNGSALSYFKSIAASGRLANFSSRYAMFALVAQIIVAAGAVVSVALGAPAFISPVAAMIVQTLMVGISIFLEKFKK